MEEALPATRTRSKAPRIDKIRSNILERLMRLTEGEADLEKLKRAAEIWSIMARTGLMLKQERAKRRAEAPPPANRPDPILEKLAKKL